MEIENLRQLVEQNLPEDPEDFLEDLILKAVMKALERICREGLKWFQENQNKKMRKKSVEFK